MANKKAIDLDARLEAIVKEEYSDFEIYLPSLQMKTLYRRKQKEYWDKIRARLKEGAVDGRTDDTAAAD